MKTPKLETFATVYPSPFYTIVITTHLARLTLPRTRHTHACAEERCCGTGPAEPPTPGTGAPDGAGTLGDDGSAAHGGVDLDADMVAMWAALAGVLQPAARRRRDMRGLQAQAQTYHSKWLGTIHHARQLTRDLAQSEHLRARLQQAHDASEQAVVPPAWKSTRCA